MEKYEKLFKGLEMCAGPECSTDCPYHGETRGGKTCRAWLLNDAALALAGEEILANDRKVELDELQQNYTFVIQHRDDLAADNNALKEECKRLRQQIAAHDEKKEPEPGLAETMDVALKATMQAEYWRGQADGMKWAMRFYYSDNETLKREISEVPEPEADSHD